MEIPAALMLVLCLLSLAVAAAALVLGFEAWRLLGDFKHLTARLTHPARHLPSSLGTLRATAQRLRTVLHHQGPQTSS